MSVSSFDRSEESTQNVPLPSNVGSWCPCTQHNGQNFITVSNYAPQNSGLRSLVAHTHVNSSIVELSPLCTVPGFLGANHILAVQLLAHNKAVTFAVHLGMVIVGTEGKR